MNRELAKTVACMSAIVTCMALGARADTVSSATALIKSGNFDAAYQRLKADNSGSGRVSGLLCYLYARSLVVADPQDKKTACRATVAAHDRFGLFVYGAAQASNNPPPGIDANQNVGVGEVAEAVQLDYSPAYDWMCHHFYDLQRYSDAAPFCKVAAINSQPGSMYYLGLMLYNGSGAVQDFEKAKAFMLASARMNYAPAFKFLGDLSQGGKAGPPKDLVQASAWYALASSAAPDWQDPVALRDGIGLSPADVAKAQKLAGSWQTKPAPGLF